MPAVIASRCPQSNPCPLVRMCPAGAISQKGFAAPGIDADECLDCGICSINCGPGAVVETPADAREGISPQI